MDAPGDDDEVDDVEDEAGPEDGTSEGEGSGLPPEGDDPMDGAAPSG